MSILLQISPPPAALYILPSLSTVNNSMHRRVSLSLHRFISHQHRNSPKLPFSAQVFPSSLSSSVKCRRSISSDKVVCMADRSSSNSASSASSILQKNTNRLASEHSPYLLQHAHNPVCFVF